MLIGEGDGETDLQQKNTFNFGINFVRPFVVLEIAKAAFESAPTIFLNSRPYLSNHLIHSEYLNAPLDPFR